MNKRKRFIIVEKWLFRSYLIWVATAIGLLTIVTAVGSEIEQLVEVISELLALLIFVPVGLFITAIIRIIIFLVRFKGEPDKPTIWRSVVTLFTSPIMEVIYVIFVFTVLLSMSSCTYNG